MPNLDGPLGFPLKPDMAGGKPSLQVASEAMDRQQMHSDWHEENPGNYDCPPELTSMTDYADIERGCDVLNFGGGGTIEPGDGFVSRRGR